MLQPSLDDVVLSLELDSSHVEYLCWRMPLLVHTVEAGEAQPDHSPMLVQGHVAPVFDDGAAGHHLRILARLVEDDKGLYPRGRSKAWRSRPHTSSPLEGVSLLLVRFPIAYASLD